MRFSLVLSVKESNITMFKKLVPLFFPKKYFLIEGQLIYNIILVSGIQSRDSVFLQIICHYRLLEDNGYSFLCCTMYPVAYLFYTQQFVSLNPIPLICPFPCPLPFGNHKFVFYIYESVSVLHIQSFVLFFRFHI